MKQITLLVFVLVFFCASKGTAQIYAEGKNVNKMDVEYLTVVQHGLKAGVYDIIYNTQGRFFLTDSTGQKIVLNKKNNPDTLFNYFYKNGWELVATGEHTGAAIFKRRKQKE